MNQLTTEVKLSNLNKAKRKLEDAIELIFDAGTLYQDSIERANWNKFSNLRSEVTNHIEMINQVSKDLRLEDSQNVKLDPSKPHEFESTGIKLGSKCIYCNELASNEIHQSTEFKLVKRLHAFVQSKDLSICACSQCGLIEDDAIHVTPQESNEI